MAAQLAKGVSHALSPGQREGNRCDVSSCFGLNLDRPACRGSEIIARAHTVDGLNNSSFHRLGGTRALPSARVTDGKVRAPQIDEVPRHERASPSG